MTQEENEKMEIEETKVEPSKEVAAKEEQVQPETEAPKEEPKREEPQKDESKKDEPKKSDSRRSNHQKRGSKFKKVKPVDEEKEGIERVIQIKRVSKVVKGGKNFSFNALVVSGDTKGSVGIGFGKSNEVVGAITKATQEAKRTYNKVNTKGSTIPHEIIGRFKSTQVVLKPASPGTGVIAGGSVRAMCDAVGIKDILTKCLGSRNVGNILKATMDGFMRLRLARRQGA